MNYCGKSGIRYEHQEQGYEWPSKCRAENQNMGKTQYYKSQDKGSKLRLKNNIVDLKIASEWTT